MTREEVIQVLKRTIAYESDFAEAKIMAIEALSTDIVRCKDCKHRMYTEDGESDPYDIVCDYHMSDGFDEKDFCSYGERRKP